MELASHAYNCNHTGVLDLAETLDELDFSRSICGLASSGDFLGLIKKLNNGVSPNTTDSAGYSALHYAARRGHLKMCSALVNSGANVNMKTKAGGSTPLHRAVIGKSFDVVKLLLDNGADLIYDFDKKTAIDKAYETNDSQIIGVCERIHALISASRLMMDTIDGHVHFSEREMEGHQGNIEVTGLADAEGFDVNIGVLQDNTCYRISFSIPVVLARASCFVNKVSNIQLLGLEPKSESTTIEISWSVRESNCLRETLILETADNKEITIVIKAIVLGSRDGTPFLYSGVHSLGRINNISTDDSD